MLNCFNKYEEKKRNYLDRKIIELYHFDSYDLYNDSYIIDIDDYCDDKTFTYNCIKEIEYRINIMNKYSVLNFDECRNSNIQQINKLKGLIIYCGEDNWNLQDTIYDYIYSKYDLNALAFKYGIMLIVDY